MMKTLLLSWSLLFSMPAMAFCQMDPLQADGSLQSTGQRVVGVFKYRMQCEQPTHGQLSVNAMPDGYIVLQGLQREIRAKVLINNQPATRPIDFTVGNDPQIVEILVLVDSGQKRLAIDDYQHALEVTFNTF